MGEFSMSEYGVTIIGAAAYNPYLELLFSAIHDKYSPVYQNISQANDDLLRNNNGFVHIHWEEQILSGADNVADARELVEAFAVRLRRYKKNGGLVVWTMHNSSPHEDIFSTCAIDLRSIICTYTDRILMHAVSSISVLERQVRLDYEKLRYLPHPSYLGKYNLQTSENTKRDQVVLFGKIRHYKRVEWFLKEYVNKRKDYNVLVAGDTGSNDVLKERIMTRFSFMDRITLKLRRIKDGELKDLFARAKCWLVLSSQVMTSGALHLGLQVGSVIVAPDEAPYRETLPAKGHKFLFRSDNVQDLFEKIEAALSLDEQSLAELCEAYLRRAQELAPPVVSRGLGRIYDELVA
jgi:glycosyltransferase involved in cell wall biosynthesis